MECLYCGEELRWDDVYGRNLRLDYFGNIKDGFIKEGDIYRCDNEECEYQGFFYTHSDSDELHEGYPCQALKHIFHWFKKGCDCIKYHLQKSLKSIFDWLRKRGTMLDTYSNTNLKNTNNFNYNINAVSGTIRKSHPKSIITKVKLDDTLLDKINPKYTLTKTEYDPNYWSAGKGDYRKVDTDYPVVILQVMLCGENQCLIEFVLEKDFNEETKDDEI